MSREPIKHVVRRKWTRRDLFKAAPLASVGLGVAGLALTGRREHVTERTVGTCRFCLMRCGIECVVENGRLVKVEGSLPSRTRGFVCEHGFALRELVHSNDRVQHPLIRKGDAFHEVSWEEALRHIALELARVKATHGGRALAHARWLLAGELHADVLQAGATAEIEAERAAIHVDGVH